MQARVSALRHALNVSPCEGRDESVVQAPDTLIVACVDEVYGFRDDELNAVVRELFS